MKSTIDWNEIVPLLPQSKREDLYLEAITLLARSDMKSASPPAGIVTLPIGQATHDSTLRYWRTFGIPGLLSKPGRIFKVNNTAQHLTPAVNSSIGYLWTQFCEYDTITYADIDRLCNASKKRISDVLSYLWSRRLIDVVGQ